MAGIDTVIGVALVIVAIPFGLMIGPLTLGLAVAFMGWRHMAASLEIPAASAGAASAGGAPAVTPAPALSSGSAD